MATPTVQRSFACDRRSPVSDGQNAATLIPPSVTTVWGLPFATVTYEDTIRLADQLICRGIPEYLITANLQYLMLSEQSRELGEVNGGAALIVADGMPIVWRSRWNADPLPERVAGADLIYGFSQLAAERGYRVFFLGGEPGVGKEASRILAAWYPGLQIAGVESPPFGARSHQEETLLIERIRSTSPDLLFTAMGQPQGEQWLHRWHKALGIPLSVQLGGSFNFVAGRARRAPAWIGRLGMEWFYRFSCEPTRLGPRYWRNACFLGRSLARELVGIRARPRAMPSEARDEA